MAIKTKRSQERILAALGAVGAFCLLLLPSKLTNEIVVQGSGILALEYHFAFGASLVLFSAVALLNALSLMGAIGKIAGDIQAFSAVGRAPRSAFCSDCGGAISLSDMFCSHGGHVVR